MLFLDLPEKINQQVDTSNWENPKLGLPWEYLSWETPYPRIW